MPELRQNYLTKEWVIIATERAKRPEELATKRVRQTGASFVPTCPFCPGNEGQTPPEIVRYPAGENGSWKVRVVANKFAALSPNVQPVRTVRRSRRVIGGFGHHEVIIDTPDHAGCMALMADSDVATVLRTYKARYDALTIDRRIAHVTVFKNHGTAAGASLQHPHSQLIATPIISYQIRQRFREALTHYDEYGECMFCQMLLEDLEEQKRIVLATDHFVALELFGSGSPFCTHIYPRRHMASFGEIGEEEIADLAKTLRTLLAKLYYGLDDPDFNYTIRSAPVEYTGANHFHWYVSVIPRLTQVAGFELGSGMFINTVLPEAAAEFLRNVKVEHALRAGAK